MSEFQTSTRVGELPEPDADAQAHSRRLQAVIEAAIDAGDGAIGFDEYMQAALYAPGLGYYSAGSRKFGADGDFVTAPEVSPLFARCLARQCVPVLRAVDQADVLEVGAGSGIMAAELLRELDKLGCLPQRYLVLEVSPDLRARQQETLRRMVPELVDRVVWLDRLPDAPIRGCVFANEVVDALPVRCFHKRDGQLFERVVVRSQDALGWAEREADDALRSSVAGIESETGPLIDGYQGEVNAAAAPWLASLADALAQGLILLIDYGDGRRAHYHPERADGTLLCHYRHRSHGDPFWWPGLNDITTQVDFTALAEAGLAAGLEFGGFTTQGWFLLASGLQEMAAETDPERDGAAHYRRMQEIKTLTLPTEMGERFKVLGLHRGLTPTPAWPLLGFALYDLRDQL
ncbi:MAG: SAM-dependent methyltransferase [Gammaproteobacteria bacterium]|nr:SAM-dependent methyltransferase [Gammaproteobacteria bacterium]MCP5137978.1 SAM-dependent methyltransferase [Gammaproteobacteria bacterium]